MKFELSPTQIENLKKFKKKIKRKYGKFGTFEYKFTPIGIGTIIEVYSKLDNKSINLTEEDNW